MQLRIAAPEDCVKLSDYYKNFPISGWAELKVDRQGRYFSPYDIQTERNLTYLLTDKEQNIEGTASFAIQQHGLQGIVQPIAWGRDLRISPHREARLEWTKHFLPVLEEVKKAFNVKHVFTVLNLMDTSLINTFIRARTHRPFPRYHMYRRFNLVSVHGKFSWEKNPLPHIKIIRGTDAWLDRLADYIIQESKQKDLSIVWNKESFLERFNKWKGLKISDFFIAIDNDNNIIGCTAPWSSEGIQEFIPIKYSLPAHNFRQFLKFAQYLGWTHPLTKPIHRLQSEVPLKFKYLIFLNSKNEDVFKCLLHHCFEDIKPDEFLLYHQMRTEIKYRSPKGWITSSTPYGIFCLLTPEESIPKFLHPTNERTLDFEPFFI